MPVAMSQVQRWVPLWVQNWVWHRKAQSCSLQVDNVDMTLGLKFELAAPVSSLNLRLAEEK